MVPAADGEFDEFKGDCLTTRRAGQEERKKNRSGNTTGREGITDSVTADEPTKTFWSKEVAARSAAGRFNAAH